jgi:hemerythrin-like metal-binding protein
MAYIDWSPLFSVGVNKLDMQHKELVRLINLFGEQYERHHGHSRVPELLAELIRYAQVHFRDEEELMELAGYADLEDHRAIHEQLMEQIFDLNARYESGDLEASTEVMDFLRQWLIDHILKDDMKYRDLMAERGIA